MKLVLILLVVLTSCSVLPEDLFVNPQASESVSTFIPPTINETPDTGISVTVNYETVNIRAGEYNSVVDQAHYGDVLRVRIQPDGWAVILYPQKWYGMRVWSGCLEPNIKALKCEAR
jgi:hypothetical protein